MCIDTWIRLTLVYSGVIAAMLFAGCTSSEEPRTPTPPPAESATAAPTPAQTATTAPTAAAPTATAPSTPSPTAAAGPPAPTNATLRGVLPDTSATVTPGEAETGRVSIQWDYAGQVDGFRVYEQDCSGAVGDPIEVEATERMFGLLQPCRPGGAVGVSAYDATGESEITWAVPGEATT